MPVKLTRNSGSYAKDRGKITFSSVSTLIDSIKDSQDKIILNLFIKTGITPQELVNISYRDIDFSRNSLKIRSEKSKKSRLVRLTPELAFSIQSFANPRKLFLFSTRLSPQLTLRTLGRVFEEYSKKFGVKLSSSNLRKLYLIHSLSENKPEEVKKSAGLKRLDFKETISDNELVKLRGKIGNERDRLLFDILFSSGLSLYEILNLKTENISGNRILVEKIKREIIISEKLASRLTSFIKTNKTLTGKVFDLTGVRVFQLIKYYSLKAKVRANPRILRNSFIANSIKSGKSIKEISSQTGIRNLNRFHLYGTLGVKND